MRALVLEGGKGLSLQQRPFSPLTGECTIRVLAAGICGTDLQLLEGYADFAGIPGHEFVGVVERAPAGDTHWVGKRVAGEINVGCGTCDQCRGHDQNHCPSRTVVGIRSRCGAFAEYLSLPAGNLHEIPHAMADETAVFAEPTAAACRILEQVAVSTRDRVAVLGDGRLGLIVAQVLGTATPHVTVFGPHDDKLRVARGLGIDAHAVASAAGPFDIVVDVTGRADGLQRAMTLVRPRGTVVMKTTTHGEAPFSSWPAVVNEVTLVGSRCGPFPRALALLASGAVQVKPLISGTFALEEHACAFAAARGGLKVLFNLSA